MNEAREKRTLISRLGPGIITAAVVLGPGSIVASSRAGAQAGYGLVWVLFAACILMAAFTAMSARLGCALVDETPIQYLRRRWGASLAFVTGFSAWLVATGFQFGNNIGVAVAFDGIMPGYLWVWPLLFTTLSIVFIFKARAFYRILERLMLALVAFMLTAFTANLFWTGISPTKLVQGFVPHTLNSAESLIAPAMLATTFSAVAAFYQAYLVQAKGWKRENVNDAIKDAWLGIAILGSIALIIMIGAAQSLHGTDASFGDIGELARQLSGILGPYATYVFCAGLAAASFSSFIANALIGGALLADGLGKDANVSSMPVRICTTAGLLVGCAVALAVFTIQSGSTTSVLIAQASTLVAAPICAVLILVLSSNKEIMADLRNKPHTIVIGLVGLCTLAWLLKGVLMKVLTGLGLL